MAITRITALWTGFRGAPGYSNFFFTGPPFDPEEARLAAVAVRNFFFAIRAHLPSSVTIQVQPTGDVIDEATGQITEQVDFEQPPTVAGSGGADYSAASGAVVNWNTTSYRNGRRVRGRTFLVPLGSITYDGNGDLDSETVTAIRTAATELATASLPNPMVVWSRPRDGSPGQAHAVTSASVPDLGAILRSRRD